MKLAWLPEGADRRYCLFLIKEDGFKIKIKDPKYKETSTMGIEQLKKWCKEQAEYYEGEMDMASESNDEEYYKYCDGMQYAYWSVYHKIEAGHK